MNATITDEMLAGWRQLAAVLTGGLLPGDEGYGEPYLDRHPPYASGSFHDGWVRICTAQGRETCRVGPDRAGSRRTEYAGAIAGAGPALHAAAEEIARLRVCVAQLEQLAEAEALFAATTTLSGWRRDGPRVYEQPTVHAAS